MARIVGRKEEVRELEERYYSGRSEFVAIYGRRRIGKTFLVNEVFRDRFTFKHAGLSPFDLKRKNLMKDQLQNFHYSLIKYGYEGVACPSSWLEAFFRLEQLLERQDNGERQVVFIDELPWMDTQRSNFLTGLEAFWNGWGCSRDNLMLVVCGSATSWMMDKLINNHGGLYNRLTNHIHLDPFTLAECEEFYRAYDIPMNRREVAESYMVLGGVPFYMNLFERGGSLPQNIDRLFFSPKAKLGQEFDMLFGSLFVNPNDYKKIIRLLGKRHAGFSREEISQGTGIANGGGLTDELQSLEQSGFIKRYRPVAVSEDRYKIVDPFCLFWLKFKDGNECAVPSFWQNNYRSPMLNAWRGIAFEELCFNHIDAIKRALGISGVSTRESALIISGTPEQAGMQIDLLIQRSDLVVNLCEMKYYRESFAVDKEYWDKLQKRANTLEQILGANQSIRMTLVTPEGLVRNEYSSIFHNVITFDNLFD